MPLVLTLHRARDPADRQRETRTLNAGRLSIGRGAENGWTLQDPAQHLSKVHCTVEATANGFVLTDCSSNGVFLNGARTRMPRGSQAALADGDEFTLGDYLIQVREVAEAVGRHPPTAPAPRGAPPAIDRDDPFGLDRFLEPPAPEPPRAAPALDPFADPDRGRRDDPFGDGFDDLLGAPPPAHRPFDDPAPARQARPAADPFDVAAGREHGASGREPGRRADAFGADDDLFSGVKPSTDWSGPSQPDNVDGPALAFSAPKPIAPPDMDAWDDLLGDPPAPAQTPAPPAARPPEPVPPTAMPAAPAPASPAAAPATADAARLVAAFLEGAGVGSLDVSRHEPEAWLREAGALFATMVESVRDVLMSRTAVKGEFGVEQTVLRPRDNNALKFSVTPADAVAALLQPGRPGYMAPMRATREAFDDIRLHQIAVMAGVQAALFNLLRTFDPAVLESRLAKGGMIESLLPATRRAKLWEAFCAAYKDIARDADSDFQTVFGREFVRAYNEQARSAS